MYLYTLTLISKSNHSNIKKIESNRVASLIGDVNATSNVIFNIVKNKTNKIIAKGVN